MHTETILTTFGCLLHDIGKVVYRAGTVRENHSQAGYHYVKETLGSRCPRDILDCVRFHHKGALRGAKLSADSPAYIAYLADNISAAADRREDDTEPTFGFDKNLPLSPVFLHMNGKQKEAALPAAPQDGTLRMPISTGAYRLSSGDYSNLLRELTRQLKEFPLEEEWINSLLTLLETLTSSIPSSTAVGESPDISLFDHLKITAAAGGCISEYLRAQGETDYRSLLVHKEAEFYKREVFLLYSADFSGIQKFIYTVATDGALRSLRSRSFFLELVMEHYVDELLTECGLSRCNLLYSGGGHCYLLLPNTHLAKEAVKTINARFNQWLSEQFGIRLYLADGYTPCTPNDLMNRPAKDAPYREMFRRVSSALARRKLQRYSGQELRALNQSVRDPKGRECVICGRGDTLSKNNLCLWCEQFGTLSRKIQSQTVFLVTADGPHDLQLPSKDGMVGISFTDEKSARNRLLSGEPVVRIYTKNTACTGLKYSTRIYVGDYAAANEMEELADSSAGIRRLGVCRMDVDNLGQAFVSGFEQKDKSLPEERGKYVTLSRTSAFSRSMSLFFKGYINPLLSGQYQNRCPLKVAIVYSGGDDVFLVGAWNDVIQAAQWIHEAFQSYTCGSLTISAGIGLFDSHYPIRMAAEETALLEEDAKGQPGKNSVALFAPEQGYTFSWDVLIRSVLGEKYRCLDEFFSHSEQERGMSFLYHLNYLLRELEQEKIHLARYAYLLARMEPSDKSAKELYRRFSDCMYSWALDDEDREQLRTAIMIYVYTKRGREE